MRKLLAITCVLGLTLILSGSAFATDTSWRFELTTDATDWGSTEPQFGVITGASDGNDANDNWQWVHWWGEEYAWTASTLDIGSGAVCTLDIRSPFTPPPAKTWELRTGAAVNFPGSNIRLTTRPVGGYDFCPTTLGGQPVIHRITLVNNRGKAGAPANGTYWNIYNGWTVTLPLLKLSSSSRTALMNEGYVLTYTVFPEPSSMVALGVGVVGLMGFVVRRRRV